MINKVNSFINKVDNDKFVFILLIDKGLFLPFSQDGEEAAALVKELVLIVQRLGVCTGRMEEGALRVDANVSIRRPGDPLSTRTEVRPTLS